MKNGPYKMKYTNGKTADPSAFPFKESPAKLVGAIMFGGGTADPSKIKVKKDHRHTSDYIVDESNEEGGETTEDIGTAVTAAGQQMGIAGNVANKTNTLYEDK